MMHVTFLPALIMSSRALLPSSTVGSLVKRMASEMESPYSSRAFSYPLSLLLLVESLSALSLTYSSLPSAIRAKSLCPRLSAYEICSYAALSSSMLTEHSPSFLLPSMQTTGILRLLSASFIFLSMLIPIVIRPSTAANLTASAMDEWSGGIRFME